MRDHFGSMNLYRMIMWNISNAENVLVMASVYNNEENYA